MDGRERLHVALSHREPDRIPIDFGGYLTTSISLEAWKPLVKHLGIPWDGRMTSHRCQLPEIPESLLEEYGVDTRNVYSGDVNEPSGSDGVEHRYTDRWGIVWERAVGEPFINRVAPLQSLTNPGPAEVHKLDWPDPSLLVPDCRELRMEAERHKGNGHAVVIGIPARTISLAQRLRGFDTWLLDTIRSPAFAEALLAKCVEIGLEATRSVLEQIGDLVDVAFWSDDMGMGSGPLVSPATFRAIIKPYQKRIVEQVRELSAAKIVVHSDGGVAPLIPDWVEIGVDAINPVQHNLGAVKGMDPAELKREYGGDISFWGGIDTSHVLPFCGPQEVRAEVRRRIDELAPGGGFVLASVHNVQPEVPPENVVAMLEAAADYGAY